jgi:hypothetical protein
MEPLAKGIGVVYSGSEIGVRLPAGRFPVQGGMKIGYCG